MKKFLLLSVLLLVLSTGASARKILSFGPKVGLNFSTATGFDSVLEGGKLDAVAGLYAEVQPFGWLGASIEALYSGEGFTTREMSFNNHVFSADMSLGYIAVPIMAKLYVLGGLSLNVGYQPSFLIFSNIKIDGGQNVEVEAAKLCSSIPVGVSYSFGFGLLADLRYNIGLSNINPMEFSRESMQNRVWTFSLAWKF